MKKLVKWGLIGAAVVYVAGVVMNYAKAKKAGAASPVGIALRWPLAFLGF